MRKKIIFSLLLLGIIVFQAGATTEESMNHIMTRLVLQLAVVIISAKILGYFFSHTLKQPKVLGELAAGMLIGPYALGAISLPLLHGPLFPIYDGALPIQPELYGFAVHASIILLFLSGLETDLPTFLRFSGLGSIVGLGGVVVSFLFGDLTAVLLLPQVESFMDPTALFLGTLSTATSVGITARILSEKRKMSSPEGVTILAAAVLDDVVGIILLAVVVGISKASGGAGSLDWARIGLIAAKAFGFWLICTVIGIVIAPRLTKGLKHFEGMDTIAGIAFGIALILAGLSETVGLAMIIGAYVTGLSLSQTDIAHEIRENLSGLYSFFVPIFFCVMGMMVDFASLIPVLGFGLIFSLVAIAGKIIGCGVPSLLTGFNLRGAFRVGAGMLPRGEVTLIVAGIGLSSGAIGKDIFGVAIMTLLVASITAPPLLIKSFDGGTGYTRRRAGDEKEEDLQSFDLEFPSLRVTDFIRQEMLNAFKNEEFFIHRIDSSQDRLYHIRKDDILITLAQTSTQISVRTSPKYEQFVRLLLLEQILELQELFKSMESMKDTEQMGANLLMGLFAGDES